MAKLPPTLSQRTWNIIHEMGFNRIGDFHNYVNKHGFIPQIKGCGEKSLQELVERVKYYNEKIGYKKYEFPIEKISFKNLNPNHRKEVIKKKSEFSYPKNTSPFKILELLIHYSFEGRENDILMRKSSLFLYQNEENYAEIGVSHNLTGERIRQLLVESERNLKRIITQFLNQNPKIFIDSIYNEKNWSSYFLLNIDIANEINNHENTRFSQHFYSYIFNNLFKEQKLFKVNEESYIFMHHRLVPDIERTSAVKKLILNLDIYLKNEGNKALSREILSLIIEEIADAEK